MSVELAVKLIVDATESYKHLQKTIGNVHRVINVLSNGIVKPVDKPNKFEFGNAVCYWDGRKTTRRFFVTRTGHYYFEK